jgi:hypothetical protein
MPEIKITQMPELLPFDTYTFEGGTEDEDLLPIIDDSEADPALKNKKVKISTLFEHHIRTDDALSQIREGISNARINKSDVLTNGFNITTIDLWYFLKPTDNRIANLNARVEGATVFIKNTSTSFTLQITGMLTNDGLAPLSYTIPAGKTIQIIFDGTDHHVIALD